MDAALRAPRLVRLVVIESVLIAVAVVQISALDLVGLYHVQVAVALGVLAAVGIAQEDANLGARDIVPKIVVADAKDVKTLAERRVALPDVGVVCLDAQRVEDV